MQLRSFLYERYKMFPLTTSTARIVPGMVLDADWEWALSIDSKPVFGGESGLAWELAGLSPSKFSQYSSVKTAAAMVVPDLSGRFAVDATLGLPQFGLSAGLGLKHAYKVNITISMIGVRSFQSAPVLRQMELVEALFQLRRTNEKLWREYLDNDFLVFECWYADQFRATFASSGNVTIKAALKEVGVDLKVEWENESTFRFEGDVQAPFAVRGTKL